MKMEIDLQKTMNTMKAPQAMENAPVASPTARPAVPAEPKGLTITQSDVKSLEDVPDEKALDRNDDLGKLVSKLFNMPAPPMPKWS